MYQGGIVERFGGSLLGLFQDMRGRPINMYPGKLEAGRSSVSRYSLRHAYLSTELLL